jgi:hypothetical protein
LFARCACLWSCWRGWAVEERGKRRAVSWPPAKLVHLISEFASLRKGRTTILKPSATSLKSLAARTRPRTLSPSSRRSKSVITGIHGSPTSVSNIVVARFGGSVSSEMRLSNGFSIFYSRHHIWPLSLDNEMRKEGKSETHPAALQSPLDVEAA